jgi:hypothetical protein
MMKSAQRILVFTIALLWSTLFLTQSAHAYLDPGTGSYFIQVLMAALLGGAFTVKMYWHRLRTVFSEDSSYADDSAYDPYNDTDIEKEL